MRYNDFIAVLVKGMQEQQPVIETQDQKLADLQAQIDELRKLIGSKNKTTTHMKTFLTSDQNNSNRQTLVLPTCTGIKIIDTYTIIRIEAISNYSKFFFNNGKTLVVAKVLRWFEECLGTDQFIRLHRTHIVNKKLISQYSFNGGGTVELMNGERIAVSRRRKSQFLQSWNCVTC